MYPLCCSSCYGRENSIASTDIGSQEHRIAIVSGATSDMTSYN